MRPHLVRLSHVACSVSELEVALHRHEVHELLVIVGGRYEATVDGRRLTAEPGYLVHYPAGLPHIPRWASSEIDLYVLQYRQSGPAPAKLPRCARPRSPLAQTLCHRLEDLIGRKDRLALQASDAILEVILLELHEAEHGDAGDSPLVRSVRQAIYGKQAQRQGVGALARACGLSRRHFIRRFQQEARCSPAAYERKLRLELALTHLARSDLSLAEIARRTGLGSPASLRRLVIAETGLAPGAYRRRSRLPKPAQAPGRAGVGGSAAARPR